MVPDFHHLPMGEDLGVEGKKAEERVIDFQGRKLLTFRADGVSIYEKTKPIKTSYVIIPGFLEKEKYKTDFNIPISEVSLVKEHEKDDVIATVAMEYGIPRRCISCW